MKQLFTIFTFVLAIFASSNLYAQRDKVVHYQSSQSRILEPNINSHITPLVADIEIIESAGRIRDTWTFSIEEVAAMSSNKNDGQFMEMKARAIYLSAEKYKADVIVAATFNIETSADGSKFNITVVGYPGVYKNWRNIKPTDYEWIKLESQIDEKASEKTQAIDNNKKKD